MFKAARRNPKSFSFKLAQLGGTIAAIKFYNATQHEDHENLVSKYANEHNFILHTNWAIEDENGDTRYVYFKIPLDNSQSYYKALIESGIDKFYLDREVDLPGLSEAIKSYAPADIDSANIPTIDLILGGVANIDLKKSLWEGKNISVSPFDDLTPEQSVEDWDLNTPEWAKGIGRITGWSPRQIEHGIDAYFARSELTWLSGKFFDRVFGPGTEDEREMMLGETLSKIPISRRFIGLTLTEEEKLRDQDNEDITEERLKSFIVKRGMKSLEKDLLVNGNGTIADLYAYKHSQPKKYHEMLQKEIDFALELDKYGKGYRSFWIRMRKPISVETKAKMFYRRLKKAKPEEKIRLDFHRKMFGYDSEAFNKALFKLRAEDR